MTTNTHQFYPRVPDTDYVHHRIRELGFRVNSRGLRFPKRCPYCGVQITTDTPLAGHHGIMWGHAGCTFVAFQACRLILSPYSVSKRPKDLWPHCLNELDSLKALQAIGVETTLNEINPISTEEEKQEELSPTDIDSKILRHELKKIKKMASYGRSIEELKEAVSIGMAQTPKEARTSFYALTASTRERVQLSALDTCYYFKPCKIIPVVMHESMRPTQLVIDREDYLPTLEELWKRLGDEKFKEWKREHSQDLPRCDFHQGRWGLKDGSSIQLGLEYHLVEDVSSKWLRYLYFTCPGAPTDWDGKPPIRG